MEGAWSRPSGFGSAGPCPALRPQDLAAKLREAEETQSSLQAECDQYRSILAETVRPGLCDLGRVIAPLWAQFLWLNGEGGELRLKVWGTVWEGIGQCSA